MAGSNLNSILRKRLDNPDLLNDFLRTWPLVEAILESFSKTTGLPLFVYLNEEMVFQSSMESMPPFCQAMLTRPGSRSACINDGLRRAKKIEPEVSKGVQRCHAGMTNLHREVDTCGIGNLHILFGALKSIDPVSLERRHAVIASARRDDLVLFEYLAKAEETDFLAESYSSYNTERYFPYITDRYSPYIKLMDDLVVILEQLFSAVLKFRSMSMSMAHELTLMLLGMGLLVDELGIHISEFKGTVESPLLEDLSKTQSQIRAECQVVLFIVRNFLSHFSEQRYLDVMKPHSQRINLREILVQMVDVYTLMAAKKDIVFDLTGLSNVPIIYGVNVEIRRLFHNVLNNAVKYSYHSVPGTQRIIRISSKIPYDPGFHSRRFSIAIENYGLGVAEEEKPHVFKTGFRGKQAIAEVPVGSGIGLSEAAKIMRVHQGQIRFQSKEVHHGTYGLTYLTTVDLIFPYKN